MRTIQRDLISLSAIYPLVCDEVERPFGWSWLAHANVLDLPGMDSHTALAFYLAREHLTSLLPTSTIERLEPHFHAAAEVLNRFPAQRGIPTWKDKIRLVQRGPALAVPSVQADVHRVVDEALLRNYCLDLTYRSRSQQETAHYRASPLGIVLKDGLMYLICVLDDYDNVRMLALHRIEQARLTSTPAQVPADFDLDDYIARGSFNFVLEPAIRLQLRVTEDVAFHLEERPLAPDQTVEPDPTSEPGDYLVTATLPETSELHWWLLGFGEHVTVLAPAALRARMAERMQGMAENYSPI